jgi:hypothetical protein
MRRVGVLDTAEFMSMPMEVRPPHGAAEEDERSECL